MKALIVAVAVVSFVSFFVGVVAAPAKKRSVRFVLAENFGVFVGETLWLVLIYVLNQNETYEKVAAKIGQIMAVEGDLMAVCVFIGTIMAGLLIGLFAHMAVVIGFKAMKACLRSLP